MEPLVGRQLKSYGIKSYRISTYKDSLHQCFLFNYLQTPKTAAEWLEIARCYEKKWNYPNCIGAIDGKHFRIVKPKNSGSLFFNYKHYCSVQMLALVDANYCFTYVEVGAEGRLSDGGQWQKSKLKAAIAQKKLQLPPPSALPGTATELPFAIVGDDAFALDDHMSKPFNRQNMDHTQRIYNYRLSRARRCSENAFGILASRFRLFLKDIHAYQENATKFILAGVCLHNFLRQRCGRSYMPPGSVNSEDPNQQVVPGDWRQIAGTTTNLPPTKARNSSDVSKANRQAMADYFVSEAGSVPWQDKAVTYGFTDPKGRP